MNAEQQQQKARRRMKSEPHPAAPPADPHRIPWPLPKKGPDGWHAILPPADPMSKDFMILRREGCSQGHLTLFVDTFGMKYRPREDGEDLADYQAAMSKVGAAIKKSSAMKATIIAFNRDSDPRLREWFAPLSAIRRWPRRYVMAFMPRLINHYADDESWVDRGFHAAAMASGKSLEAAFAADPTDGEAVPLGVGDLQKVLAELTGIQWNERLAHCQPLAKVAEGIEHGLAILWTGAGSVEYAVIFHGKVASPSIDSPPVTMSSFGRRGSATLTVLVPAKSLAPAPPEPEEEEPEEDTPRTRRGKPAKAAPPAKRQAARRPDPEEAEYEEEGHEEEEPEEEYEPPVRRKASSQPPKPKATPPAARPLQRRSEPPAAKAKASAPKMKMKPRR